MIELLGLMLGTRIVKRKISMISLCLKTGTKYTLASLKDKEERRLELNQSNFKNKKNLCLVWMDLWASLRRKLKDNDLFTIIL